MELRPLLVDASVWIDYLNDRQSWATERLEAALDGDILLIGDLTLMEVLQGIRTRQLMQRAEALLRTLPIVEFGGERRARESAANYRLLRALGITPRSSIDVLVATFCAGAACRLLATDRDFNLMAPHVGLDLLEPPLN